MSDLTRKSRGEDLALDTITSDETRRVMEIIFYVVLNGVVSVLGVVENVINIVVFVKQGFHDSINISFCGLAVSDLGSLLPLVWTSICFNPLFRSSGVEFDVMQICQITAGWPHVCFSRITSLITAFITLERCVCIALPLKVKDLITPKRTCLVIFTIFIAISAMFSPLYSTIYLSHFFHPHRNTNIVGVIHIPKSEGIEDPLFSTNVALQFFSIIFVMVCALTMIRTLLANSRWQHQVIVSSKQNHSNFVSSRDKRVMKMVTTISSIFIACYLPNALNLIFHVHFSTEYNVAGKYQNTYFVSWCFLGELEAINSSVTTIVYYKMSSKFRTSFRKMFCERPRLKMAAQEDVILRKYI